MNPDAAPAGRMLPVSDFLKPAPPLVPERVWRWCAHRFFRVDEFGEEQLKPPPAGMPLRAWRFLCKGVFAIDVYKLRSFQQAAPAVLKEAVAIAPQAWLYSGTLLGCIRDGRILPWDRDIDLGFPCEAMTDDLLDRFRAAGFSVEKTYVYARPSYREYIPEAMGRYGKVVIRKVAKIEFYCFARGKDGRLYYGQGRPQLFVIDHHLVYPQRQVPFYDFTVNVPERFEENLVYMYGADWRVPKRHWAHSAEHRATQERFFIALERERKTGARGARA
jgi:hypothetical protein